MELSANPMNKRLRLAGSFIVAGLLIQALSLLWNHPLSFIAFLVIGGLLVAIGVVIYLLALVSASAANANDADNQTGRKAQQT
jgi:predicted membrane channel-forming protein YqfA (hemolysin III family)